MKRNIFNAGACAISQADIHLVHDNDSFLLCQLEKMISDNFCSTKYGKLVAFQFWSVPVKKIIKLPVSNKVQQNFN